MFVPPKDFVAKWSEWIENGWFEQIEKLGLAPENRDAYLGATKGDEYWIGMLFAPGTPAPNSFEYVDNPMAKYAVFQFEGKRENELLSEDGINLVFEAMQKHDLAPSEFDCLCIERYSRPNPSVGKSKVLLECLYAIQ